MIKSWKHKGLKRFYETGKTTGILVKHGSRLKLILQLLDRATYPKDMDLWNLKFHKLKGQLKGQYAVKVSGNWRVTFGFEEKDAVVVDYLDYH